MNWKRYWLASVAVIIGRTLIAFFLFAIVFSSVYDQEIPGGRPEGEELHIAGLISMITWALAFTYVFARGYQNKGWLEGIRFGLVVWVFYFIPMLTGYWAYFLLPTNWVMASLVAGLVESLGSGLITSLIYKGKYMEG
jgi:hypothetical protein